MSVQKSKKADKIREERMIQIEASALVTFAKNGYQRTKMSMIAQEAGVSEGLIYRYYESKEQLFIKIVEGLMEESSREIHLLNKIDGTPLEQIKFLTEKMLDEQSKIGFMFIEQAKKEDEVPKRATELMMSYTNQNLIDYLVPIFKEGQEQGELIADDPRKVLSWYFYIVNLVVIDEQGDSTYGFPSIDMLLRFIKNS
ncbi:TetR/AcrR family transcriptional regulator [Virgibacillus sp. MSJ-26]|nr:TetR/AcrR family transcriptional regulator [Virgibacillus sp. MSJ-26]MBU5468452.1 TetR/AcrR family transcriptional regulator [Virgibacillus sp. MSJ-26]